jgi:hypothetical protein
VSARACAVCGEITTRARIHGFTAWENSETGETRDREIILVVHAECYMRLEPAERDALLARAAEDVQL